MALKYEFGCDVETAFELLTAGGDLGDAAVSAVLIGAGVSETAAELTRWFENVHVYDDPSLAQPDGDYQARVLAPLIDREKPLATLIPHTNTGMVIGAMMRKNCIKSQPATWAISRF